MPETLFECFPSHTCMWQVGEICRPKFRSFPPINAGPRSFAGLSVPHKGTLIYRGVQRPCPGETGTFSAHRDWLEFIGKWGENM